MPKLPQSWLHRHATLQRTMLRNTAAGRTSLVAPQPRPLEPLDTAPVPTSGITAAGKLLALGDQTIPSGTTTRVTCLTSDSVAGDFDAVALAGGGITVDTANSRINIDVAGTYHIGGQVIWADDDSVAPIGFRWMLIHHIQPGIDGYIAEDRRPGVVPEGPFSGARTIQSCSGIINCYAGDHIVMDVAQDSGGDLVIGGFIEEMNLWCYGIGVWGG